MRWLSDRGRRDRRAAAPALARGRRWPYAGGHGAHPAAYRAAGCLYPAACLELLAELRLLPAARGVPAVRLRAVHLVRARGTRLAMNALSAGAIAPLWAAWRTTPARCRRRGSPPGTGRHPPGRIGGTR